MEILLFAIPVIILLFVFGKFEWKGLAKSVSKPFLLAVPVGIPAWQRALAYIANLFIILIQTFWQMIRFATRCAFAIYGLKKPSK